LSRQISIGNFRLKFVHVPGCFRSWIVQKNLSSFFKLSIATKNNLISFLEFQIQCPKWTHPVDEISFWVCRGNVVLSCLFCKSCPLVVDYFSWLEVFSSSSEHVDFFIAIHNQWHFESSFEHSSLSSFLSDSWQSSEFI